MTCRVSYFSHSESPAAPRPRCGGFAFALAVGISLLCLTPAVTAQPDSSTRPRSVAATKPDDPAVGRPVIEILVSGNRRVADSEVLNVIRTEVGEPFNLDVVTEDYQRIYALRRFSRVEALYENTPAGVRVVFNVEEQPLLDTVTFRGNEAIDTERLRDLVEFESGRSFDPILLAFAKGAIEELYRSRNYAFVNVEVIRDEENRRVVFDIVEGPRVLVRNIDYVGARSFGESRLGKQIGSRVYWPLGLLGHSGRYDPRQVSDDVAALKQFYRDRGFFDVRVGRKIIFSPDLTEAQIDFLIDEGKRYVISEVRFDGNERLTDDQLRAATQIEPGDVYDADGIQLARRELIEAYSPFGLIYSPPPPGEGPDPDYLSIVDTEIFELEPGKLDVQFTINEGKPFRVGNIEIRGNGRTKDKVLLRQFDLAPGQLYDSDAVQSGQRRLQALNYFDRLSVTPIGDDPDMRDLLIEVEEGSTALFTFGGAVSSNGGVVGTIRYEQRNFDIFDWPESAGDTLRGDAFVGAGQNLRIILEPGTFRTNAQVAFYEPYLFDQNFGFGTDAYYRSYRYREYQDRRAGGKVRFVPRIGRNFSTGISFRGEDVRIHDIDEPIAERAPEYLQYEGNTTLTSIGGEIGYSRLDNPMIPSQGVKLGGGWESFGLLGGDPNFQRLSASFNGFLPLHRDLTDRPTVLEMRADSGFIYNDAPFFERFYAGGFGSVRGFRYRGISPRSGPSDDAVGGDFSFTGSAGLGFPLYGETLRGVVFSDFGTVESDLEFGTIRSSAGFGFRLNFEALGNVPIAFDLAWPLNRTDEDDTQVFSFSLGLLQ